MGLCIREIAYTICAEHSAASDNDVERLEMHTLYLPAALFIITSYLTICVMISYALYGGGRSFKELLLSPFTLVRKVYGTAWSWITRPKPPNRTI